MPKADGYPLGGGVAPGFEEVEREFRRNFAERGELGAACAAYVAGEKVVDLWGGYRDARTHKPWEEDTLVLVYSTTKGVAALTLALAHSRGLIDYDERVAAYWPEFARGGKEGVTVRQLLAHQAGLCAVDAPLDLPTMADPEALAEILARQRPAWEPGTRHGYHYLTLGWCQSELIRRTDPRGRSLGRFFRDEVARPLGLEFHIGLPPGVPDSRVARIEGLRYADFALRPRQVPWRFVLAFLNPRTLTYRTLRNPAFLSGDNTRFNGRDVLALELPSANGVGQVRGVAKLYGVFAAGGEGLRIRRETLEELERPAVVPPAGLRDEVLLRDVAYSLGLLKPWPGRPFGGDGRAYGVGGVGGSAGFADPAFELGYAYGMTKLGPRLFDDPRERALRDALYRCLRAL